MAYLVHYTAMTSLLFPVLIASCVIMLASLAGVVFTWKTIGVWLKPRLHYMVALATGVLMVMAYSLIEEALHEGLTPVILGMFILGGVLLEGITLVLPKHSHHHHHGACEHVPTSIDARRVLLGDAMHNVHDGLVLVPAFMVSPAVGIGTTLGVFLHEVVQEIAEFFILTGAGYSAKKALIWNFIVSTTLLLGIAISILLVSTMEIGHSLVALSAGGFTYIIFRDLLPSIIKQAKKQERYLPYLGAVCIGALLVFGLSLLLPHNHEHADEDYPLPEGFGLALNEAPQNC